jgi:hypothetical protein
VRSASYGCFLSGGLAGHVYGAEGIWGGDIEDAAPVKMWDAFTWKSGDEMQHLKTFAFSIGKKYQDLEPQTELITPNRTRDVLGYEGWAYCARTPDRENFLIYFERGCPLSEVRGTRLNSVYTAQWFNPRTGEWTNVDEGKLSSSKIGIIKLPHLPSDMDWGLKLVYSGPVDSKAVAMKTSAAGTSKEPNKRLIIGLVILGLFLSTYIIGRFGKR